MSIFFRSRTVPVPENFKKPIAWAALVLLLAAGFAAGYLAGHGDNPAPIVIEKVSGIE